MSCTHQDCDNHIENPETGLCATHGRLARKALIGKPKPKRSRIKQVSDKKTKELSEYSKRKKAFFSIPTNRICRVCGLPAADSIHHGAGKVGYWDDEAREESITLLLDERFWIPIHSFNIHPEFGTSCHDWTETHPIEAKKLGLSFDRLK
jgi:hypothetical protein